MRIDDNFSPRNFDNDQIVAQHSNNPRVQKNNYVKQMEAKSRAPQAWNQDTEVMASIATERVVTQYEEARNSKPKNSGPSKHRRKQSANVPYKVIMHHTNIGKLSDSERLAGASEPTNCHFSNNNDHSPEEDEE
jgi:hypothetical protein